jgi:CubicO group peptidase (beta-lactamase class C family)
MPYFIFGKYFEIFNLIHYIIENVAGISLAEAFHKYICIPLGLENTYLPTKKDDFIPNIYYKNNSLYRQGYMISGYNYDSITTAKELMIFLKAFWGGLLFRKDIFEKLSVYKKLQITMGPSYYGGGYS